MRIRIEAENRAVGVEGGRIVPPEGAFDVKLRIAGGELRPGLINAHDHLHRNHYGRLGAPPYPNAYVWGHDVQSRFAHRIAERRAAVSRREALLAGAWKNLFSGVTTVVHHDPWEPDFERAFPIRVVRVRVAHSLGFEPNFARAAAPDPDDPEMPLSVHVAEGIDAR